MAVKPKLALIPSGVKAGKVYSVLPSDGTGDFDFSRSGSATRVNKDGLIETVGSNIPRLNYPMIDGVVSGCPSLLLEPQRSNLITYSEAISNTIIKKGTFADNFAISPDGKQNATKLTATNTDPYFYQNLSFSAASYTASIYVKGIGNSIGKNFQIRLANNFFTYVIPSEWTRFECTATLTSGTASVGIEIPNPAVSGDEVLVWGWQLEQGSYATSYIPTNGSTVTRVVETCNNAGDANTFNDSEGVLYVDSKALFETTDCLALSISDGTLNNSISFIYNNGTNQCQVLVYDGGSISVNRFYALGFDRTNFTKFAIQYFGNTIKLWVNGSNVTTDNGILPSNLSTISTNLISSISPSCKIKYLKVYDTALTDTQLQQLTG